MFEPHACHLEASYITAPESNPSYSTRERLTYWQAELKACEAEPVLPEHQTNVAGLGFSQEELQKYIPQFRTINVEPQETPETTKSNLTCPKCGYTYTQQEFELLVKEAMQNRQVEAERPKP